MTKILNSLVISIGLISPAYAIENAPANQAPVAEANAPQRVTEGTVVALDGSNSYDPDNAPSALSYDWRQIAGPGVVLSDSSAPHPVFDAPMTGETTLLTFQLIVDDGAAYSSPSVVDIMVEGGDYTPVAESGTDHTSTPKVAATTAWPTGLDAANAGLESIRELAGQDAYESLGFQSVGEMYQAFLGDPLPIEMIEYNELVTLAPTADPATTLHSVDQLLYPVWVGENVRSTVVVQLGSDGMWRVISVGDAKLVELLENAKSIHALASGGSFQYTLVRVPALFQMFLAYTGGDGEIYFVTVHEDAALGAATPGEARPARAVLDSLTTLANDTTVMQAPEPPAADAGAPQTVGEGATVTLDGSASHDPYPGPSALTYSWSQTAGPQVVLSDGTVSSPSFDAPQVEETRSLTFELVVYDGEAYSASASVEITVENVIDGGEGGDALTGTDGDDVMTGYSGRDTITTGAGDDQIVYTATGDFGDTIQDFEVGSDRIQLGPLFSGLGITTTDPIADGYLLFSERRGDTYVQFDQDGPGGLRPQTLCKLVGVSAAEAAQLSNFLF